MTKAMTKAEEEKALADWRSSNSPQSNKYNYIKLDNSKFISETEKKNPNFGKIFAYSYKGEEESIDEIKKNDIFFPVVTRVQVACRKYAKDSRTGKKKAKYWCRETDIGDDIELFNSENESVFVGQYKDAKEDYELKYQVVVYTFFKENIYRWKIGGESLTSWFEVMNEISNLGFPHSIELTEITPQSNDANIFWNILSFKVGEKFDLRRYIELKNQIGVALKDYYNKQNKEEKKSAEENANELEDIKVKDNKNLLPPLPF